MRTTRYNVLSFLRWLQRSYHVHTPGGLRKAHCEAWLIHLSSRPAHPSGRPLKPSTINKNNQSVKGFLKYMATHDYIRGNMPLLLPRVQEPKTLPTSVLTHAQMRKLLSACPTDTPLAYRNRAVLELLYSTGLRAAELLGLDEHHVDLSNATALVTGKGNKQRVVPIGHTALRYVESYVLAVRPFLQRGGDSRALFLTRSGTRLRYRRLLTLVKTAAERAGLSGRISPHTFRRSCTTELVRGGAGLYQVKELLGHASLHSLTPYTKLTINDLRRTHQKCHPRERDD
jgi:integrase/recombinase XerD